MTSAPLAASQTWANVSDTASSTTQRHRSFEVRYGRQTERDEPEYGRSSVTFKNQDRRFDPENTAGPYYPNLLARKRIRVRAVLSSTTYPVFQHFIDPDRGFAQSWVTRNYAEVGVDGYDALAVFAAKKLTAAQAIASGYSGAQVGALLDLLGWPAADRNIDTGKEVCSALAAGSLTDRTGQDILRLIARTDPGFAYVTNDGIARFQDRQYRIRSEETSAATFADGVNWTGGRFKIHRLDMRPSQIVNHWRVKTHAGASAEASDATSITNYGPFSTEIETLHISDYHAARRADWDLSHTKDQRLRLEGLTIKPGTDTDTWTQVLTRDISDRITVIVSPPGGGSAIQKDFHIEGIHLTVPPTIAEATCTWRLGAADPNLYWLFATAGRTELGTATRLAY